MNATEVSPTSHKHTRALDGTAPAVEPAGWASLEIFADLSVAERAALAEALEARTFADGEVLLHQGEPGTALYLLEAGRVRVEVTHGGPGALPATLPPLARPPPSAPPLAVPAFVGEVEAPAALGEMALIMDAPRTATVWAVGPVRCLTLDRPRFEALIARAPEFARVLTRMVGERLKEIDGIRRVGKYEVTGVLGSGGVARVFSGRHPELGLPVALKMLSHAVVYHPHFAAAFDEEARLVAGLRHPNIVHVYDFERAYGTRFIVMERLEGRLLEEAIQVERLPWATLRAVLTDVARALEYVHQAGLVHRDVKPDNIFLTEAGTARLIDFGIATRVERSASSGRLGTPFYMAPEQVLGQPLDGRTDLYALGLTAYEAAARRVPFDAPTLDGLLKLQLERPTPSLLRRAPDAPEWLLTFIERATAKRPSDRFPTAQAAADFLAAASDAPAPTGRLVQYAAGDAARVERALERLKTELAQAGVTIRMGPA